MPLKGLPAIITSTLPTQIAKEFNAQENEVLAYILGKPKQFKHYTQSNRQSLGVYLTKLNTYLGIKDVLDGNQCKLLVNTLCNELPTFTYEELNKAVQMAVMGKFEGVDNNHYQHLSPQYISAMVSAYKKHRGEVFKKYQRLLERLRREEEPKPISKKEAFYLGLDLLETEYADFITNTEQYCDSEYRNTQFKHLYGFLRQHKLIEPKATKDDEELKTYILSWFKAIQKEETTPRVFISDKFCVPRTL